MVDRVSNVAGPQVKNTLAPMGARRRSPRRLIGTYDA